MSLPWDLVVAASSHCHIVGVPPCPVPVARLPRAMSAERHAAPTSLPTRGPICKEQRAPRSLARLDVSEVLCAHKACEGFGDRKKQRSLAHGAKALPGAARLHMPRWVVAHIAAAHCYQLRFDAVRCCTWPRAKMARDTRGRRCGARHVLAAQRDFVPLRTAGASRDRNSFAIP